MSSKEVETSSDSKAGARSSICRRRASSESISVQVRLLTAATSGCSQYCNEDIRAVLVQIPSRQDARVQVCTTLSAYGARPEPRSPKRCGGAAEARAAPRDPAAGATARRVKCTQFAGLDGSR
jgi:hypothetical protein